MQHRRPNRALLTFSIIVCLVAFPGAALFWRHGKEAFAVTLVLLGLSLGPSLAAYASVPIVHKQAARRVVLLTGGLSIMAFSLLDAVNMDLEGFFMLLFLGTAGAAFGHTVVTVLVGPLFFGRFLCGWGCWRAMILELLPIPHTPGRRGGGWSLLPFLGLALSLAAASVSVFVLGHHPGGVPGAMHTASRAAIFIGFAIYYAASIGMAFKLRDPRAFCKYLCPSGLLLGRTSRVSMLKMTAEGRLCNACGACSKVCPMDIDIARFAVLGQSVRSGQCILCQRCAHACPTKALHLAMPYALVSNAKQRK